MASKAKAPAAGLSTQPQPLKVFLHPSLRSLRTRHAIWARRLAPLGVLITRGQLPEPGTFLAVVDVEVGAASYAGGSSGAGGGDGADSYCRFDAHSAAAAQLLQLLCRGARTTAAAAGRPAAGSKRRVAAGPDDGAHPQGEAAGGRAVAAAAAGARGTPATPRGGQQHAAADAVAAAPDADSREEAAGVAATRGGGSSKTQQAGKVTGSVISRSAGVTSSSSLGSSSHSTAATAADRSAQRPSGSAASRRSLDSAALSSLAAVAAAAADRAAAATANWERAAAVTCERGGGAGVEFTGSSWRPHVARLVADRWLVACCEAGAILDPAPYDVLQAPARLAAAVAAAPHLRTPDQLPPGGGVLKTTGPAGKGDGGDGDRGESRPRKRLRWQDAGDDGGWQGANGAMSAVGVGAFTQPQDLAAAAGGDGLRAAGSTATAAATFHSSGGVTPGAAAGVAARPAPLRPWVPPRLLAATTAAAAAAAATWGAVPAPQHTTPRGVGTTRAAGAGGTGDGPAAAEAAALLATTGAAGYCSPAAVVVGHEPVPLAWWEPAAPVAVPAPALAPAVAAAAAAAVGKSAAGDTAGGGGAATGVPEGGCEAAGQVYGWEAVAVPVAGGAWVPLPDHLGRPRASPPGGLQPPRWIPLLQDPETRAAAAAAAVAAAAGSKAPRAPPLSSLAAGCRPALPRVRVVSYNILGNTACMTSRAGAAMPRAHTSLEFRGPRLLRELWGYDADIICLQEVDVSVYRLWLQPWAARHGHNITYLPRGASTPLGPTEPAPRMDPCYSPFSATSSGGRGRGSSSGSGSGGRGGAASSSSGCAGAGGGSGVPVGELDGIALLFRIPLRLLEVHCEQLAARRPATAAAGGGGGGGGNGSSSSSSTGFWSLLSNRGVGAILALVEVVDGGGAGGCGGGGGGGGSGGVDERTAQPQQGGGGGAGGSGSRGGGGGTDAPGRVFAVGTTHLWWDPRLPHVKAAQAALLCEAAADFLRRVVPRWGHSHGQQRGTPQPQQDDVPLVLAGDLNSRWAVFDPGPVELGMPRPPPARSRSGDSGGGSGGGGGGEQYGGGGGGGGGGQRCRCCLVSGVYELLSGGLQEEHPHHPACPALLQAAAPGDVRLHTSGLRLASAHMVANGREPPATNNSGNFIGCLDYLWLSRGGHWAVAGTLDLPYTYGPDPRGDGLVGAVGAGSRAASMQQRRQHGAGGRQQRGNSGGGSGAGGSGTDTEADETAEGGALGRAADAAAACDAAAAVSAAAYCPVMPNATFPSDHWAVGVELVLLGGCGGR